MLCLSAECCVKGAHPQCAGDNLEKEVCSAIIGLEAIDGHEALQGTSVGTVSFILRHRPSFLMILALQLQLLSLESLGDLH
jgi:hypothetical protein